MFFVVLHTVLVIGLSIVLARHWQATRNAWYWLSLVFHLVAGIGVGLIYTYYYSANDTWLFFEEAKTLSHLARQDFFSYFHALVDVNDTITTNLAPQDFRSMVFIKVLSLFSLATGDNYWLCAMYFSLLSFVASWFLFRRVVTHLKESQVAAALAFLIFPSVVFWSSGIEKETLTLSAVYFLAALFLQFKFTHKVAWVHWALAVVAAFVLWALKYYWAGVFFIAVIAGVVTNYSSMKWAVLKKHSTITYVICFVFIGVGVSFLHPNFYLDRFLEVVVSNHDAFTAISSDQSLIHFYELSPTVSSVAINAPWALVSGVFRPFIGEGQGVLGLAASLENLLILVLAGSAIWGFRKRFRQPMNILFLVTMSYCIVLCIFLSLSTPNLGTLSRYRVGFLPFLIFMLAYRNPLIEFITRKLRI